MPPPERKAVVIAVHDVAPATWPQCEALIQMLDDLGAMRLTLLVVPFFHYERPMWKETSFVHAIESRLARGDEVVLHGYFHRDDEPPPRTLHGFIERRMLTRAEGEFAALTEFGAMWRITRGIEMFRALRWPLFGFTPPAWLINDAGRTAISRCGYPFEYVSVRDGIYRLPRWRHVPTANVCYSPDRPWRRVMSRIVIARELRRARHVPLLRLSLHPQDAAEPAVVAHWRAIAADALASRTLVTKHEWATAQATALAA
jgi:predicted deacetylase